MTPFEKYLIESGYIAYRQSMNEKTFVKCENSGFYSTMPAGGVSYHDTIYKKDDHIIWFGLGMHPFGTPPTIVNLFFDPEQTCRFVRENNPAMVLEECIKRKYNYEPEYFKRFVD